MPGQKKQKQVKHESITIRQAQHKNRAEEAHLNHVRKFIRQEKSRTGDDVERAIKRVRKLIKKIIHTAPVPGQCMINFHEAQRGRARDVAMHVVYCYLLKQERDKEQMAQRDKDPNSASFERTVTTPDHIDFIHKAFPETFSESTEWRHNPKLVDIYTHGRAGHDMKCMSTRAKPVGGYPMRGPVNFRFCDSNNPNVRASRRQSQTTPEAKRKREYRKDMGGGKSGHEEKDLHLPIIEKVNKKIECIQEYSAQMREAEKKGAPKRHTRFRLDQKF